jgi:FkbH-like protein
MKDLKFPELIRANNELGVSLQSKDKVRITVLANITVNQLKPVLEFSLRSEGLNASVEIADYDNILQESTSLDNKEIPIIFWELCNLTENFVYEIETFSESQISQFVEKTQNELLLLFDNLKTSSLVFFNKFSHRFYTHSTLIPNAYELFTDSLNEFLQKKAPSNFILVDSDKIFEIKSFLPCFDVRNYYSTKSLYTIDFFKEYCFFILPAILSAFSRSKKAIILDCDNTLWKGIVGEDGWENIALSEKNKDGIFYKQVHLILKSLGKRGIILGLCSKNNPQDVEEVFRKRKDMVLSYDDFIIKVVNWNDKASNLETIAKKLNIGIDSLVFVDDSPFEINLVNERLPMIKTLKVPQKLYDYPALLMDNLSLFFTRATTEEDFQRARMYREEIQRDELKSNFQNIDDYLASLDIEVALANKEIEVLERVTQLTQKTNQFNLTTKRYLPGEILNMYNAEDFDVINLSVSDKYGSSGLTGVCIIHYRQNLAEIDSFLLSCRILGRNVANVFLREVVKTIHERGYNKISASYKKTAKNVQVEDFYDRNCFTVVNATDTEKNYAADSQQFLTEIFPISYIKVVWKKK